MERCTEPNKGGVTVLNANGQHEYDSARQQTVTDKHSAISVLAGFRVFGFRAPTQAIHVTSIETAGGDRASSNIASRASMRIVRFCRPAGVSPIDSMT